MTKETHSFLTFQIVVQKLLQFFQVWVHRQQKYDLDVKPNCLMNYFMRILRMLYNTVSLNVVQPIDITNKDDLILVSMNTSRRFIKV